MSLSSFNRDPYFFSVVKVIYDGATASLPFPRVWNHYCYHQLLGNCLLCLFTATAHATTTTVLYMYNTSNRIFQ